MQRAVSSRGPFSSGFLRKVEVEAAGAPTETTTPWFHLKIDRVDISPH